MRAGANVDSQDKECDAIYFGQLQAECQVYDKTRRHTCSGRRRAGPVRAAAGLAAEQPVEGQACRWRRSGPATPAVALLRCRRARLLLGICSCVRVCRRRALLWRLIWRCAAAGWASCRWLLFHRVPRAQLKRRTVRRHLPVTPDTCVAWSVADVKPSVMSIFTETLVFSGKSAAQFRRCQDTCNTFVSMLRQSHLRQPAGPARQCCPLTAQAVALAPRHL